MAEYWTFKENEEKRPLSDTSKTKSKKNQITTCQAVLFFTFIFMLLMLGSFYCFYMPDELDVFERMDVYLEYDRDRLEHLAPRVKLSFPSHDFKLDHRIREFKEQGLNEVKSHNNKPGHFLQLVQSFFKYLFFSSYVVEFSGSTESLLKLKQRSSEFHFTVKKLSHTDAIECYNVSVDALKSNDDIEMCFDLSNHSWYGGHESLNQPYWPINQQNFDYVAYVTGFADDWAGIVEPYWISSGGLGIYVCDDIPLMVKHKDANQICLKSSKNSKPYKFTPVYDKNTLDYTVCLGPNIRDLHIYMTEQFKQKPMNRPDARMMTQPVFTTWSYFFKDINQDIVLKYSQEIHDHGYNISQLEIDDKWEKAYGDMTFDRKKFPDPTAMVAKMHALDQRVTLWVHPFCNIDSSNFISGTAKGYWVRNEEGNLPGFTSWWDGAPCVILDTTNPQTVDYFTNQLNSLKKTHGIDSFKFDAGETHWIPSSFKFFNNQSKPNAYTQNYVDIAHNQNYFVEVRVAHKNQHAGIFYRILDRSSDWTIHDGLKSVLTATLHFSLVGYPFVLPDIIGGNGEIDGQKELFIRWTQLTAFLPAMQFGVPPWNFDDETDQIAKKFVNIHSSYVAPYMMSLPLDALSLVRPMWWAEPNNPATFTMSDQFMVGDQMVVAPVLDKGLTVRQVYLPAGEWFDVETGRFYQGPTTLNVVLNLNTIPYYFSKALAQKFNLV